MPENLNFRVPEALIAAHPRLTQAPALISFCTQAFDGADPTRALHAMAARFLHRLGEDHHLSTTAIPYSQKEARQTVGGRLSLAGNDELRQTLDATGDGHRFPVYLVNRDRLLLAAPVCLGHADECRDSGDLASAERAYRGAGDVFLRTGLDAQAAGAYCSVGDLLTKMGLYAKAAETYQRAGYLSPTGGPHGLHARPQKPTGALQNSARGSRPQTPACGQPTPSNN